MTGPSAPARPAPPVRVLWLVKGLGPGGAERLLVSQARARDRAATEVAVAYLLPWKDHLVPELASAGVRSVCLHGERELAPGWAWRLRRLVLDHRPDVVHVHSPYVAVLARLVVRTLRRADRPALVVTEHNRWPRHGSLTRLGNRLTLGLDDADLAVSEDVRATMPARRRARVEVLRHGVDLAVVRRSTRRRRQVREALGVADGEVLVVTVANLRREKGLDVLLDAASRVVADPRGARVRFVVVGQGPLADELAARHLRLGLDGRLVLAGYRPDAVDVVAAGDVFCLASRHEGLPVALMEALALGRPVVATAVGGVPELVTHGVEGLLVPPDDVDALAGALLEVASDPARRRRLGSAAASAGDGVGIGPAQARLERLYRELADQRSARRSARGERNDRS